MAKSKGMKSLNGADFRVTKEERPGWAFACDRKIAIGEPVYCAGGEGTILSLHGKTGDGSRLLQIRLEDEKAPPFFAAASNVLVRPRKARVKSGT